MATPLQSLIATGTKLWLDSIDPELVASNRALGATGATSNPVIVGDLIGSGRFDAALEPLVQQGLETEEIAWRMTDQLVSAAQQVFLPVWRETGGNDGYVSFELDPLLEDPQRNLPHQQRVDEYIRLARQWSAGHENRMIKIPATPAGLDALEEVVAAGVTVNVTLVFTPRQYEAARDAVWRGARRRDSLERFKSVYSIFVSRVDVYTEEHLPQLSAAAQGWVGIVNAKQIRQNNRRFWSEQGTPLEQEIIFASTGTKKPEDAPWKYVEAFAGSDIETNPPATNEAFERSGRRAESRIEELPPREVLDEIASQVDMQRMEEVLMAEGIRKFADPQKTLLERIEQKRAALAS